MKSRGGGGRSGTQVQRPKQQQRVDRKKPCDLGRSCPYQDEFQHLMEFSHECEPVRSGRGSGNSGGRGGSSSSSSAGGRGGNSFSGAGNLLGGENTGGGTVGHRLGTGTGGRVLPPYFRRADNEDDEDMIRCPKCSAALTLQTLEAHMMTHERPVDTLKVEQDAAFEQSILDDITRQSALEAEKLAQAKKEANEKAKAELAKALLASKAAAAREAREKAVQSLLPEPGAEYEGEKVTIRFTLPSGKRFVRTFRSTNSVQDAFNFLRTLEELEGKSASVRNAVNTLHVEPQEQRTFAELGIAGSTALIVVEQEEPEGNGDVAVTLAVSPKQSPSGRGKRAAAAGTSSAPTRSSPSASTGPMRPLRTQPPPLPQQAQVAQEVVSLITPKHSRKRTRDDGGEADVIDLTDT